MIIRYCKYQKIVFARLLICSLWFLWSKDIMKVIFSNSKFNIIKKTTTRSLSWCFFACAYKTHILANTLMAYHDLISYSYYCYLLPINVAISIVNWLFFRIFPQFISDILRYLFRVFLYRIYIILSTQKFSCTYISYLPISRRLKRLFLPFKWPIILEI